MKSGTFTKSIYTPREFFKGYGFFFSNFPSIVRATKNPDIGLPFRERILNVVSVINGCRYCQWFHAKLALSSGVDENELKNLLNMQFQGDTPSDEVQALLFAQHFAETQGNYDPDIYNGLLEHYGKLKAQDIVLLIRMITVGNLTGNTFDAFLSRLRGKAAEGSNALFEFFVFILTAPLFVFVLPFVKRQKAPGC